MLTIYLILKALVKPKSHLTGILPVILPSGAWLFRM